MWFLYEQKTHIHKTCLDVYFLGNWYLVWLFFVFLVLFFFFSISIFQNFNVKQLNCCYYKYFLFCLNNIKIYSRNTTATTLTVNDHLNWSTSIISHSVLYIIRLTNVNVNNDKKGGGFLSWKQMNNLTSRLIYNINMEIL